MTMSAMASGTMTDLLRLYLLTNKVKKDLERRNVIPKKPPGPVVSSVKKFVNKKVSKDR